jgi:hypothetical protein
MEGLRVVCPNCKRRDFVTTEKFNAEKPPNGSMVKCLLPYRIDWLCSPVTRHAEMTCPECCALLAPQGRLTVVADENRAAVEAKPDVNTQDESEGQDAETQSRDEGEGEIAAEQKESEGHGKLECHVCGRICKTKLGWQTHILSHRMKG